MQSARPNIFCAIVDLLRHSGNFGYSVIFKDNIDAFGSQQGHILKQQGIAGLGKDPDKLFLPQRVQLDTYRKSPLQLWNQIRWFDHMKSARADKQNMIRLNRSVFRRYGAALHNGQKISLHAFTRDVRALGTVFASYFVNFIQKDNSRLLDSGNGFFDNLIHIHQTLGFFLPHQLKRFRHLYPSPFRTFREHAAQHILKINPHFFHPRIGKNFHHGHAAISNIQVNITVVKLALSQHAAQFFSGRGWLFAALGYELKLNLVSLFALHRRLHF